MECNDKLNKLYAKKHLDSTFTKDTSTGKIIKTTRSEYVEVIIPENILDDIYERFDDGDWESHGVSETETNDCYIMIDKFLETLDTMIADMKSDDNSIDELKQFEEWEQIFAPFAKYDIILDEIIKT